MVKKVKLAPVVQAFIENEKQIGAVPVGQLFWRLLAEFNSENRKQSRMQDASRYRIPNFAESLFLLEGYYFPYRILTEAECKIDLALASVVEYIKRETGEETYPLDFKGRLEALAFYIEVLQSLPGHNNNQAAIKWKFVEELCNLEEQMGPVEQFLVAAEGPMAK